MVLSSQQMSYVLDQDDCICYVDQAWIYFALENGAASLTFENVVGQSLWSYISGDEIRRLYRQLIHQVRVLSRTHQFHFRCDSPERLRVLEMFMTPLGDGRIHLESRTVFEKPRIPLQLLNTTVPRSTTEAQLCSVCKKVEFSGRTWLELEQAEEVYSNQESGLLPSWRHALCPECLPRLVLC
jgi:hypothetical protein